MAQEEGGEGEEDDVLAATLLGPASAATNASIRAHVPVPSQEDIAVCDDVYLCFVCCLYIHL